MLVALPVAAQDSLDLILSRGYVAHWLVCGPFASDLPEGITAAVGRGEAALGDRDFMAPLGGVRVARPQHLTSVKTDSGEAIWQRAGARGAALDLAPFFPEADEGVAYAAFYARAERPQPVYLELQTPLGARVYLNGFPVRPISPAAPLTGGVDRFPLVFSRGLNLFLMEVPGARIERLAAALGMAPRAFKAEAFQHKPMLSGESGFEIALRLLPLERFGELAYAPQLENTGSFTGGARELRQEVALTLFNPGTAPSPPVAVEVTPPGRREVILREVPSIAAESEAKAVFAIPVSPEDQGKALTIGVKLTAAGQSVSFSSAVLGLAAPDAGTAYVVMGRERPPELAEEQRAETERLMGNLLRQTLLLRQAPDYGFTLGAHEAWGPFLIQYPEWAPELKDACLRLRCAPLAGYGALDERLVSGELLVRNLLYGRLSGRHWLGAAPGAFEAWRTPAIAPQTPQLLSRSGLRGMISDAPVPGVPELFFHLAPDGSRLLSRRKQPSMAARTAAELLDAVILQRREVFERGFRSDVLIYESEAPPPEPFVLTGARALRDGRPAVYLRGTGSASFFEDIAAQPALAGTLPRSARLMTLYQPGAVIAQPALKQAHAQVEALAVQAEKLASLAAMHGAVYPDEALDLVWRQLLYCGAPARLGFCESPRNYVDALAAYREAAGFAREVLDKSMQFLAQRIDSFGAAPKGAENALALIVFNTTAFTRTDVCEAVLNLPDARGLTLLDAQGAPAPYVSEAAWYEGRRLRYARIRFVARDVPGMGWKTYYALPEGALPRPSRLEGARIENDSYELIVDPGAGGAIVSLVDKNTKQEYAGGPLNEAVALAEDASKTQRGRELWTTGAAARPGKAKTITEKWPGIQRLIIEAPFAEGEIEQRITLYEGVRRIDCETEFRGVDSRGRLLALGFKPAGGPHAPVLGERFGFTVGRRGWKALDHRTDGLGRPSGTGAQSAYGWAALSVNDRIQGGPGRSALLGPAIIIHGPTETGIAAAERIQEAFVRRGIPSVVMSEPPRKLNTVWTDSTEWPNLDDDLSYGSVMRIVIGGPEENRFCDSALRRAPAEQAAEFTANVEDGASTLFFDDAVPEGAPPAPTLLLAGATAQRTAAVVREFVTAIETVGVYHLASRNFTPVEDSKEEAIGLAVVHRGAALHVFERDGGWLLAIAHGSEWARGDDLAIPPQDNTLEAAYALYPIAEDWRRADVPAAALAFAEPLAPVLSRTTLGGLPASHGLIEGRRPGFALTAVKSEGWRMAMMETKSASPRESVVLRGYESLGWPWKGELALGFRTRGAELTDPMEAGRITLPVSGEGMVASAGPNEVVTMRVAPAMTGMRASNEAVGSAVDPHGPVYTRYWRHNRGAAPLGGMPLSVLLEGDLRVEPTVVRAQIANHLADESISGEFVLTPSAGWTLTPERIAYNLEPGGLLDEQIVALRPSAATEGGLTARAVYQGRTYQDALQLTAAPMTLEARKEESEVIVVVRNGGAIPLEGYAEVIALPGYWPELHGRLAGITPRRVAVYVAPHQEQRLVFRIAGETPPPWLTVKVAANGHVAYALVE